MKNYGYIGVMWQDKLVHNVKRWLGCGQLA